MKILIPCEPGLQERRVAMLPSQLARLRQLTGATIQVQMGRPLVGAERFATIKPLALKSAMRSKPCGVKPIWFFRSGLGVVRIYSPRLAQSWGLFDRSARSLVTKPPVSIALLPRGFCAQLGTDSRSVGRRRWMSYPPKPAYWLPQRASRSHGSRALSTHV